jgi:hypothetical protein
MTQIILHLVGDYLLQNDWMANNKKCKSLHGLIACLAHCFLYSLPFLLIANWLQVLLIFGTHFLIDRWFFVKWYMNFIGQKKFAAPPFFSTTSNHSIINLCNAQ